MLLSRFWSVFLAVAAAAATAAALLAQSVINARSDEALADSLARDRVMVDAMLRMEARSRLDRIAFITVDSKLGAVLRQAREVTDEKKLRELNAQAKELMRGHVARIVEAAGDEASSPEKLTRATWASGMPRRIDCSWSPSTRRIPKLRRPPASCRTSGASWCSRRARLPMARVRSHSPD